ncbi:MAG: hypothetical protein L6Q76_27065 [Polyangiaceae bacterium]|nr:hypothetical protein [Polyangiaceae bacterium]
MGGAGGSSSNGGMGGMGGMTACYMGKCAEYITDNLPEDFCAGNPSKMIFDELLVCMCGDPVNPAVGGKCIMPCETESCAGSEVMAGGDCQKCIVDTMMGCGNEFNACANDF